jgi:predicted nucleotide-binding protein (sugar kinase/HSP70/actin superfamily)
MQADTGASRNAREAEPPEERVVFTKAMKGTHTILFPQMLPIHFALFQRCFEQEGYKVELLTETAPRVARAGLSHVHNDICYPAILVIGQMIDALQSGRYDLDRTALMITQTGGGCRASNYIHLLRKGLKRAGFGRIPVVSLNLAGLERNPGFKLSLSLASKLVYAIVYGDLMMCLANQVRPYERERGAADRTTARWVDILQESFKTGRGFRKGVIRGNMDGIVRSFGEIPVEGPPKTRVGVVGEIYIKYAPLGNNNLEEFLLREGTEPVVPGLLDFVIFKCDNRVEDARLYGTRRLTGLVARILKGFIRGWQDRMIEAIKRSRFRPPKPFASTKALVKDYLGYGNKMGEGWLLTGEMLELIESGAPNIICTQPFGCLPNHIAGKGMIRAIRNRNPSANIVAIDYDAGATRVNQENRIKLMLAAAERA